LRIVEAPSTLKSRASCASSLNSSFLQNLEIQSGWNPSQRPPAIAPARRAGTGAHAPAARNYGCCRADPRVQPD